MYKALLIGVDEYEQSSIRYLPAVKEDVYKLIKILFYSECDYTISSITSKNATCNFIRGTLNDFFMNSSIDDVLFLYWAGHGDYNFTNGGKFICYDSNNGENIILMKDVAEIISNSPSSTVFCVFDSCYSGAIARSISDAKIKINGDGRVIMMSSDYIQKSYEDSINRQGFFTKLLIDGLNGNAVNNGIITALSLHDYISSEIEKIDLPEKQTPVLDVRIAGRFILNKVENTALSTENGIISPSRQQGVERSIGSKYDLFDESKKILSDTYIVGDNLFTIANFGLIGLHIQLSTGIPIYATAVEREKALINRAINQLLKYELVEPAGKEGGVMRLTGNGIEIAEEIYFSESQKVNLKANMQLQMVGKI